jgi:hypothetical protein
MSILNAKDHAIVLQRALSSLADSMGTGELEFAASQSMYELGWSYPLSHGKKIFWAVQRAKRHALDFLRSVAASKFRYKQIYLNQRFEHYNVLIDQWDKEFKEALETEAILLDSDVSKMFGTYVTNGFIYDQHGNDISRLCYDFGIDNDGYRTRYS